MLNCLVDDVRHDLGKSKRSLVVPQDAAAACRRVMAWFAGDHPHVGEHAAGGDRPKYATGHLQVPFCREMG